MNLFTLTLKDDEELEKILTSQDEDKKNEEKEEFTSSSQSVSKIEDNENVTMGLKDSQVDDSENEKGNNISKDQDESQEQEKPQEQEASQEQEPEQEPKEEQGQDDENKKINCKHKHVEAIVSGNKRSLFHKIFGPMEAGSVRGSIFNMVILSMGTGMLALPKYISNTSLVLSCLLIIGISICVWWSLLLLSKSCEKNKKYNYSKLIELLYGKKLSILFDIIVILYSFGVLILYNCIILSNLGEAIYGLYFYQSFKTLEDFQQNSFWKEWYIQILLPYASSLLIVYPMCLIKDVSKLRIISLIGVLNIVFLIIIIIVQSKDYITEDNLVNNVNYINIEKGFKGNFDTLNFISSIFYASCFHIGCVPVISTLNNNVRRRIYKAIRRTILIDILFYLLVSVIGYLSIPVNTPSLIIQRPTLKPHDSDIVMSIGKIGLVLMFFTKLPNTYSSLRITLFDKLWGTTEITNVKNYILTFVVIISCVTCSILYSEISSYIKLMGGLFSTMVGFLFPSLLIVRSNKRKRYHWKNILTVVLFIGLTLIGFISSGFTIYGMIFGNGT